jgi:circadian clock protein KaiB
MTTVKKSKLRLRLYVAGNAPNSILAIANAKQLCEQHFAAAHELEIIDLLVYPKRGQADGIIVTPTLIKLAPAPVQRVIGNLSELPQVLVALGGK